MKIQLKDQWGEYKFGFIVLMGIAGILFAATVLMWIGFQIEKYECEQYGNTTGRTVVHRIPSGCYVQSDSGQFIPRKEFDARAITNEAVQP